MKYVYIEKVFIDNFFITLSLLLVSFCFLKIKPQKVPLILSSAFSAIVTILTPFLALHGVYLVAFKVAFAYIICAFAFKKAKLKVVLKLYITFLLSTCLFAGIYFAIYYGVLAPLGIFEIPIAMFSIIVYLMIKLMLKTLKKYVCVFTNQYAFDCSLCVNGKCVALSAYLDTGNFLYDQKCCLPVVVVELCLLQNVLTDNEIKSILLKEDVEKFLKNAHYINISSVGGNKEIVVFEPDYIKVNTQKGFKQINCVIGVSNLPLFKNQNFNAIMGANVKI